MTRGPWLALLVLLVGGSTATAQDISYLKQIQPFMKNYCVKCHNSARARGEVNVESYKALMASKVVVAGNPAKSELVDSLLGRNDVRKMPPRNGAQPTADEIALVQRWIQQGAKDDSNGKGIVQAGGAEQPPRGPGRMRRGDDDDGRENRERRRGRERRDRD